MIEYKSYRSTIGIVAAAEPLAYAIQKATDRNISEIVRREGTFAIEDAAIRNIVLLTCRWKGRDD